VICKYGGPPPLRPRCEHGYDGACPHCLGVDPILIDRPEHRRPITERERLLAEVERLKSENVVMETALRVMCGREVVAGLQAPCCSRGSEMASVALGVVEKLRKAKP